MFLIFLYVTLFIGFFYSLFKVLLYTSNYFLFIDEYFVSKIENINDNLILNYLGLNKNDDIDNSENIKEQTQKKNLNKFLRLDFLISLTLGIIWFLFPILVIDLKDYRKTNRLGKYLGIFTLISGYISLLAIKKNNNKYKKQVFLTKIFCSIIVLISFIMIITYTKKIELNNIISISLSCIWFTINYLGLIESIELNKLI